MHLLLREHQPFREPRVAVRRHVILHVSGSTMIWLTDEHPPWFPPHEKADDEGLLAVGGGLTPERLLLAYRSGIFPWFQHRGVIFWYSVPVRMVLFPHEVKRSRSMERLWRSGKYTITENIAFKEVISACSEIHRLKQGGTWISPDFIEAYDRLFQLGHAASVEVWKGPLLAGGLYGVVIGKMFCGESMFSRESNTSKLALLHLCRSGKYSLVDCQVPTEHLKRMGARLMKREDFLQFLAGTLLP